MAQRLLLVLWICGACAAGAASLGLGKMDWRAGLLVLGVVGAGVAAWTSTLRRAAPGVLNFDGLRWSMPGVAGLQAAEARVALDAQSCLLVHLVEQGGARCWVWLDRSAMPERWQDLRRAVYSRPATAGRPSADARSPAPDGAQLPLS